MGGVGVRVNVIMIIVRNVILRRLLKLEKFMEIITEKARRYIFMKWRREDSKHRERNS